MYRYLTINFGKQLFVFHCFYDDKLTILKAIETNDVWYIDFQYNEYIYNSTGERLDSLILSVTLCAITFMLYL